MLTFESNPCKQQRKIMSALGFDLCHTTDANVSCWAYKEITLDYDNDQVPEDVISDLISRAMIQGEENFKRRLRELLGVPAAADLNPMFALR